MPKPSLEELIDRIEGRIEENIDEFNNLVHSAYKFFTMTEEELLSFRLTYPNGIFHFYVERDKDSKLTTLLHDFKTPRFSKFSKTITRLRWLGRKDLYARCFKDGTEDREITEIWDYGPVGPFEKCQFCSKWYNFWKDKLVQDDIHPGEPLRFVFLTDTRPYELIEDKGRDGTPRLFMHRKKKYSEIAKRKITKWYEGVIESGRRIKRRFKRQRSPQTSSQAKDS
jgi:hypothetical protein